METNENDRLPDCRLQMIKFDLKGKGITDSAVLKVMGEVPREQFVLEKYFSQSYADVPLPIGCGQMISQPYIVALMTQALKLTSDCEVLEIGTGSGYQTSILAKLAKRVYTIDRLGQLSEQAQAVLGRLGFENIEFCIGDGSRGWPGERSFERIIVTAAVPAIFESLSNQLAESGVMVVPVGGEDVQQLLVCKKKKNKILKKLICDVRFVKLIGEYGF